MIECILRTAPRAVKKTIKAPWPPITPTKNRATVAPVLPRLALRVITAMM